MERMVRRKELPNRALAVCVIAFSFLAGMTTLGGINGVSVVRTGYHWLWELAMAFFLLMTAAGYAQRLIRDRRVQAN
ncbi:MAG TPA: hypothetical protein VHA33_17790 [Candidatus Angelobacter sp.]|jgi:hypothetical protein|nr:hypothetical protein [Candidatus Angelobacter sp.]